MELLRTERFKAAFRDLTPQNRERVEKALRLLANNPRHPSLRVKEIGGVRGIYEARASPSIRITFQFEGATILLRNVGAHDETLKKP
jgi:mRNA-degrading endonuclease RelE of RelBE toxin-antitoxin system